MQWWTRQQLSARDPARRKAALEKLAQHPNPLLEASATSALEDREAEVRVAAVSALAQLPPDRAVPALARAASHRDPAVREQVSRALSGFERESAVPLLCHALRDRHSSVRAAAARSLELLDWQPSSDEDVAAYAVARHNFMSATHCGAAAIEPLLVALADETASHRRAVVIALSELADTRTTKALIAAARDADPTIRVVALEGLAGLDEAAATEPIRAGLRDPNSNVRLTAAESLGRLADRGAVDMLVQAVRDVHWEVRKAAIEALGKIRDARALEALVSRLADSDHDVRLAAVEALGQLACPGAVEALVGSLIDSHAPVRRACEGALRRSDRAWEESTGAQNATAKLKAALSANDYVVRQAAADTLQKIGAAAAVERAPATLSHAAVHRRQAALEVFTACLNHVDRDLRLAAVEALGRLQDPDAQTALRAVAGNLEEDEWVRAAADAILPQLTRVRGGQVLPGLFGADQAKIVPLDLWNEEGSQRMHAP